MRFVRELFTSTRRQEEAYLKMARIEYFREYTFLKKSLGREPTGLEVRSILSA